MYTWVNNDWQTAAKEPVKNREIWEALYSLVTERGKESITLHHVRGHVGVPGNERVDDIARELAEGTHVKLYRGNLSGYPEKNILMIPKVSEQQEQAKKKTGKAYSYIALINGNIERFTTWAECEARVTGRSAKYKKALSAEHEQEILNEWGVSH